MQGFTRPVEVHKLWPEWQLRVPRVILCQLLQQLNRLSISLSKAWRKGLLVGSWAAGKLTVRRDQGKHYAIICQKPKIPGFMEDCVCWCLFHSPCLWRWEASHAGSKTACWQHLLCVNTIWGYHTGCTFPTCLLMIIVQRWKNKKLFFFFLFQVLPLKLYLYPLPQTGLSHTDLQFWNSSHCYDDPKQHAL